MYCLENLQIVTLFERDENEKSNGNPVVPAGD